MHDKEKAQDLRGFKDNSNQERSEYLIHAFLDSSSIHEITDPTEKVITLAKKVAEIPWGYGRTIEETLTQKTGSCTGKHRVFEEALKKIGVSYSPVFCLFKWEEQGIKYPQSVQAILDEAPSWAHGHNFDRVTLPNGQDIDIDVTWHPAMRKFGFTVIDPSWNGTDIVGVRIMEDNNQVQRWDNADIGELKERFIVGLSEEQRARRTRFLDAMFEWVATIR